MVRDPRLIEPDSLSDKIADDIVAAFESSKRRMLIVGEPGSGKTIAAYSLIEYLHNAEGDERIPLLVNLSAWEAQDDFEDFLIDYLCSSVGYEIRERAVASAFIGTDRYALILDGLDEIPLKLRAQFSELLDEYVRGLAGEVGVVVTCRTQDYKELLDAHPTGLALVRAVEILPLSSAQLDSAFLELAKRDKAWEAFLSQRHLSAYQRVRRLLSKPLFLNLAVVSHLRPGQLLDWSTTEQELQDIVLDRYLDRTLEDQSQYTPADARRYLTWIARFLNEDEVSPFGLKTSDSTVFDLAHLTPAEPPTRYRWLEGLVYELGLGLAFGWFISLEVKHALFIALFFTLGSALGSGRLTLRRVIVAAGLSFILFFILIFTSVLPLSTFLGPTMELFFGLIFGLIFGLVRRRRAPKHSALRTRLTLVWPSTRQRRRDFFRKAGRWVVIGLVVGLIVGLVVEMGSWHSVFRTLILGMGGGAAFGLVYGLNTALVETRPGLILSYSLTEASSRSLSTALVYWLITMLVMGLAFGLALTLALAPALGRPFFVFSLGLVTGLFFGLLLGGTGVMNNGGWFVLLQKIAYRRLARDGNLPPHPYNFLEWGIEQQVFRQVGGGVRFRHDLIQQQLAKSHQ